MPWDNELWTKSLIIDLLRSFKSQTDNCSPLQPRTPSLFKVEKEGASDELGKEDTDAEVDWLAGVEGKDDEIVIHSFRERWGRTSPSSS